CCICNLRRSSRRLLASSACGSGWGTGGAFGAGSVAGRVWGTGWGTGGAFGAGSVAGGGVRFRKMSKIPAWASEPAPDQHQSMATMASRAKRMSCRLRRLLGNLTCKPDMWLTLAALLVSLQGPVEARVIISVLVEAEPSTMRTVSLRLQSTRKALFGG